MTKDEALRMALEALTNAYWPTESDLMPAHNTKECADAITAIKEALAQEQEQEPVAWMNDMGTHIDLNVSGRGTPLYTTPPQRKPLTDDEIWEAYMESPMELDCSIDELYAISRTVEAKLKERNT